MAQLQLNATSRERTSTRGVRRMRKQGQVPAIVYGKTVEPVAVSVNRQELLRMLNAREGQHGLLTLRVAGDAGKGWEKPVLIKIMQRHPVTSEILHIDFHAIALTERIRVKVPVVLNGEPVGVKQDGGLLEHFLREVEIECLPTQIPKQIEMDIAALKIGDTIHAKDLTAPEGARITSDAESVIASVHAPKAEKAEEVTEAVTEPEVIREKKPEAEAEGGEAKPEKGEKTEKKEEKK
jgi:large subunit ribosomal protein L25